MAWTYHGIPITVDPRDAWTLQEIVHLRKPQRIVVLGTDKIGMSCWLLDCMKVELLHPFVVHVADAPKPNGIQEWADLVYIEGPPDVASFNRVKNSLGAPTMLISEIDRTSDQRKRWNAVVTVGHCLAEFVGDYYVPDGFKQLIVESENMRLFEKAPISVL